MNVTKGGLVLFSANSNASCVELAKRIGERLGVELGKVLVYQEPNRETRVQIQESVRGKDVFIIQTVSKDVNTTIMELLIMVLCLPDVMRQDDQRRHPLLPLQQAVQDEEEGLHCLQAVGLHDV
ncbi:unnamed protein product [Staurois parvus]|uniref:Phosphoribosyl pyrophosphate synthase-associated protein 2 n=1 Tax=Staurois parvus TaxID=386267 RepID=A0ABN9AXF9_9NEOB|nr:unnamed protein product [Staurois parvus]